MPPLTPSSTRAMLEILPARERPDYEAYWYVSSPAEISSIAIVR
jgi:hypothetical protein